MAEADDYEAALNRILTRVKIKEIPDLVRAMRSGIAAEMKPKFGDTVPAFKGSQLLSFFSSQGLKQPDERMFLARELLSRGYIAHVPAGSKQPNVLDFHDGNRYRFTQKDVTHSRMRRSVQPGTEVSPADVVAAAPPSAPSASGPSPRAVSPPQPVAQHAATATANATVTAAPSSSPTAFHHIRGQIKHSAKPADGNRLLLGATRATPVVTSRARGSTDTPMVEEPMSSPPTSPIARSAAVSAAPRPALAIDTAQLPASPPSASPPGLSGRGGGTPTNSGTPTSDAELEKKAKREKKERKEKKEKERLIRANEKEKQRKDEALTRDHEPSRPSRAPIPPPRFMEKPVHITPPSARSAPAVPPPPLLDVLSKGEQEYLKVLQNGHKAFIEPLSREKLLSPQEVRYVAGNLTTIIALHEGINAKLKDGTPPEAAIIAVAGAIPSYLLYIANLTAALELIEDARNEPRFLTYANEKTAVVGCTFETFLQLPQRHLQFYLRLRSPYASIIPHNVADTLSAAQKTLEERTRSGVDSRVWDLQRRLASTNPGELPKGPLSLDGVFERRDKPKLKHLALFLFADKLVCASVANLPNYRIKELLSLQDLEVIDLPDAQGRKYAVRISRQQKAASPPLLVCFPSEEDKSVWTESLPGVRRMLRVPLEL